MVPLLYKHRRADNDSALLSFGDGNRVRLFHLQIADAAFADFYSGAVYFHLPLIFKNSQNNFSSDQLFVQFGGVKNREHVQVADNFPGLGFFRQILHGLNQLVNYLRRNYSHLSRFGKRLGGAFQFGFKTDDSRAGSYRELYVSLAYFADGLVHYFYRFMKRESADNSRERLKRTRVGGLEYQNDRILGFFRGGKAEFYIRNNFFVIGRGFASRKKSFAYLGHLFKADD